MGKSILAVQLAETLASGCGMDGFQMAYGKRTVLYVDLVQSDEQFQARYSQPNGWVKDGEAYKFADRLYRGRPRSNDDLVAWIREKIAQNKINVVIIDDLSALRTSHDGTREALLLMRELRKIKEETHVSVLVLTDSDEPPRKRNISERDMRRSRVLCGVADSVFAIGQNPNDKAWQYLIQTRSQCEELFWNVDNAPQCWIEKREDGFLGMRFDDRFERKPDTELIKTVCTIKQMHDSGRTFREIGEALGISKSKAALLIKDWTPAMAAELAQPRPEPSQSETQAKTEAVYQSPFPKRWEIDEREEWEILGHEPPPWAEFESPTARAP